MSKERLEEIQKEVNYAYRRDGSISAKAVTMPIEHYEHLYEQAERVQELEEKLKDRDSAISTGIHVSNLMKKQNKRYREAIQEVKKSLITARKSYSNNKVNQQVYESLKTIQELEESE